MRWLVVLALWALALLAALFVLWRLWRGRNVVLRGRWSPRFVRMVVIVLVVLGVGVEKGKADEPARAAGGRAGRGSGEKAPAPDVLNLETVRAWHRYVNQGPFAAFKHAFAQIELEALAPKDVPPKVLARLIEQLDDDEYAVRRQASHRLRGILAAARPALAKALQESPSLEKRRRIEALLTEATDVSAARGLAEVLPARLKQLVLADLNAVEKGQPAPPPRAEGLLLTVDELERSGVFDHWVNAYLWRKAAQADDRPRLAELFARLHRHARLASALTRAGAEIKPYVVPARAWMSKAGPSAYERSSEATALGGLLKSAQEYYAGSDIGTWEKDAVALLTAARDAAAPVLVRAGKRQALEPGQELRFNRLDLLEVPAGAKPAVLEHAWLGRLTLPAGRSIAVWDLPGCLTDEARATVKQTIADALAGSEQAAGRLEKALPLVHELLRQGLVESPAAKGAPRLRLVLSLFDDAVMPAPEPAPGSRLTKEDLLEDEFGGRPRGRGR